MENITREIFSAQEKIASEAMQTASQKTLYGYAQYSSVSLTRMHMSVFDEGLVKLSLNCFL